MTQLPGLIAACLAFVGVGAAATAAQGAASPADCAAIQADAERLACYDALFRPGSREARAVVPPSATAPAASPAAPAAPVVEAKKDAQAEFGLPLHRLESWADTDSITSRVVAVAPINSGRPMLTLENGQRWVAIEQIEVRYFRSGDLVRIRKAALGSFLANKDGLNRLIRVRRID